MNYNDTIRKSSAPDDPEQRMVVSRIKQMILETWTAEEKRRAARIKSR